jgi:tRNA(His) 5'-end guanylyltransferase
MYNDKLGDEMKDFEGVEAQRRFEKFKPIIARIDGRTFHTFTKGMQRPYDDDMSEAMINTTIKLVESTHATIGYTQSDEITLIWANQSENSAVFFDGRIQKMCSQLGALSTLYFNREVMNWDRPEYFEKMPTFDARVWQVPDLYVAERT